MPERSFSVVLGARIDAYEAAMARARAATRQFSSETEANLKKVGGQMQSVGRWSTTHISAPLAGLTGVAVKMGYSFDQAFTRMVSLAGVAASEIDGLKEAVLDLSGETAVAPQDLASALYEASSAGLDTQQALDAVRKAARASAAGMGSAADVVGLVASATAAYGSDVIDAAQATDVLTAAIREGRADPEELAGTLGRILPFASQLGISFGEVGGTVAYLSNVFGDTNRTVTAMSGLFAKLLSPTQQGREALSDMGTSAEELQAAIDARGLLGALDLLRERGFAGNQQALTKLFDDIEGRQAAMALLADNSGTLAEMLDTVANSAGAADDAFSTWEQSDSADLAKGLNELRTAGVELGETLLPIAADIAGGMGSVASSFAGLPGPVKTGVIALGGVATVAGPLIWATGTIIKNTKEIGTAWQWTQQRLRTSEGQLTSLGRAAKAAGVLIAGVAAVQIGGDIYNQVSGATETATRNLQRLNIAIGDVSKGTADANVVMKAFRDLVAAEDDQFKLDNFKPWGDSVDDLVLVGGKATRTLNDVKDAFGKLLDQSPEQAAVLIDSYQQALDGLGTTLEGLDPGSAQFAELMQQFRENNDVLRFMRGAYDDAVGSQEALTESSKDSGQRASELAASIRDQATSWMDWLPTADDVAAAQQEQEDAQKDVTDAVEDHIDALQRLIDIQQEQIDQARAAADSTFALRRAQRDWNDTLDELPQKIKDAKGDADLLQQAYDDVALSAVALADATVTDAVNDGWIPDTEVAKLDTFNRRMLELAASVKGPAREAIVGFIAEQNKIDPQVATDIVVGVDEYGLDTADQALQDVSATRDTAIRVDANTAEADDAIAAVESGDYEAVVKVRAEMLLGDIQTKIRNALGPFAAFVLPAAATGMYASAATIGLFGEDGAEWIAPLTKPGQMKAWLTDPRIRGPVTAALGIPGFAEGGIIGRVLQSGGAAGGSSTSDSSRMANRFEFGDISAADYRAYLAEQLDGLEEFSDEWADKKREIAALDADEIKRQDDKAKAAKEQADAVIAEEDRKMAALYEAGVISNQQYEAYLQSRLGDYEQYSVGWMEKWRTLNGVQEQAERDALARREEEAKAALRRLEVLFAGAENRHRLAVAEGDLADAWNDVEDARRAVGDATDDEGRRRAERQVADALNRVADGAWDGAKARAAVNGLAEGTREWAQFMRSEVTAYIGAHPELSGRLSQWLESVPRFASGGHAAGWGIAGERGPELINFGAGANVYDAQLSRHMMSAASLGGGGSDGLLRQIVDRLNRLEMGGFQMGDINVTSNDARAIARSIRDEMDRTLWQVRSQGVTVG